MFGKNRNIATGLKVDYIDKRTIVSEKGNTYTLYMVVKDVIIVVDKNNYILNTWCGDFSESEMAANYEYINHIESN